MNREAKEAVQSQSVESLLQRLAHWWRCNRELMTLSVEELDRMSRDLGMTVTELQHVASMGPDSAALLHQRMDALGVTSADIDRLAFGLVRDLERDCSCCASKDECRADLVHQPESPGWMAYCANAQTLDAARKARGRVTL